MGKSPSTAALTYPSFGELHIHHDDLDTDNWSISHPDRAGFGFLLSVCADSLKSPAGFANQPDQVFFYVCVLLSGLVLKWSAEIGEDTNRRDDLHRFVDELSKIGLYERIS